MTDATHADITALMMLVQTTNDSVRSLDSRLTEHMSSEAKEMAHTVSDIMDKSFPAGDPEAHRLLHEEAAQIIKDRAAFWAKMRFEVTKYGLLGIAGWLAIVAWTAFVKGPK